MKLMENWKRFWTLNRHHAAGFTLVELIVVIAILAILAGVAVPAYSGYIAQANKAADEQLLDALNTAFASACAINGENHYNRTDNPVITVTDGLVGKDALTTGNEKIDKSFAAYFEGGTFKVFTYLAYSKDKGCFEGKELPAAYANLLNTLMSDPNFDTNKAALLASTFMTADGLGAEGLMDQMGYLSGMSANLLTIADPNSSSFYKMVYGSEFFGYVADKLGCSVDEMQAEYMTLTEDERNAALSNALVLNVAEKTANLSEEDKAFLNNTSGLKTYIETGMKSENPQDVNKSFAQASLAYGMYVSYANSQYGNAEAITNANNVKDSATLYKILEDMDSESFKEYQKSQQYKDDMDGYTAAMDVINSASSDPAAVKNLIENGYNDPALIALFQQAMGN